MNAQNSMDPAPKKRDLKIFFSATLADMTEERDLIFSRIVPEIRQKCEQRRVAFSWLDLRAGEQEEKRCENTILRYGFYEIDRCRPFFISVLGEKYGWVPQIIPSEIIRRQPWLANIPPSSLSEMEITYAALLAPKQADLSLFYFRSPAYAKSLPREMQEFYLETPPSDLARTVGTNEAVVFAEAKRRRQGDLKNRIRWAGLKIRENYANPSDFADLLKKDLSDLVDKLFPPEEKISLFDQETLIQKDFIQHLTEFFLGRQSYFGILDQHVQSQEPPLVLWGESGSGKSSLLANWVRHFQKANPAEQLLFHSAGISSLSANKAIFLRRLMLEIKRRFNLSQSLPERSEQLPLECMNWLNLISNQGRMVLVLDDFDQLKDSTETIETIFPATEIPANVRLIISIESDLRKQEYQNKGWKVLPLAPLETSERKTFIRHFLKHHAVLVEPSKVEGMAFVAQTSNPLYLLTILEQIRFLGNDPDLDKKIADTLASPNIQNLLGRIFERIEKNLDPTRIGLLREALTLIRASRRGLTQEELLALLGITQAPLSLSIWAEAALLIEPFLMNLCGMLNLYHPLLREVVAQKYLPEKSLQNQIHLKLADFFWTRELSPRVVEELPFHLAQARAWQKLHSLLGDPLFFSAACENDEYFVKLLWKQIEKNSTFRMGPAFTALLKAPERHIQTVDPAARILAEAGYLDEALSLLNFLSREFRRKEDRENLCEILIRKAELLQDCSRNTEAGEALAEAEQLCRLTHPSFGELSGIPFSERDDPKPDVVPAILGVPTPSWGNNLDRLEKVLFHRALMLEKDGKADEGIQKLKRLETLYKEIHDATRLQACLGHLGHLSFRRGDLETAQEYFREQGRVCREIGKKDGLSEALNGQAQVLRATGDMDSAILLLKENEKICRDSNYKFGLQKALNFQAILFRIRGDLDGAISLLKETESICREIRFKEGLQSALGGQAQISRARGNFNDAVALFKEQETICRETGSKEGLQIAIGGQAVILKDRGCLDEAMKLAKEAEKICRDLGYKSGLQRILGTQAMILKDRGDLDGAMALLREGEALCRGMGLKTGLQRILEYLATVLKTRGDLDGAMALFREQEKICRDLGIKAGLQVSLGNQANILYFRGDLDGAMALYNEQEAVCRELGLKDRLHISLGGQAVIFRARAEFDRAMELLKKQEKICLELGLKSGLQISLFNQGIIHLTRGDLPGAMNLFKDQEKICREAGFREGLQASLGSQAVVRRAQGDLEGAMALFKQQEKICRESGYKEGLQVSLCGQAAVLLAQGSQDQAMRLLWEGEKICRELNHKEGLQRVLCSQSMVLQTRNDMEGAMILLQEAEKICRSLDHKSGLQRILENQAVIRHSQGNLNEAMELLKKQEKICRDSGIQAGLAAALGQQALIHKKLGNLDEATTLLKDQEVVCREVGIKAGLAKSLAYQAEIMAHKGENLRDALFLAAKAFRIAKDHGYMTIANQIKDILNSIRSQFLDEDPIWKEAGDMNSSRMRLAAKAAILEDRGDLEKALAHLKEHEKLCRESGHLQELAVSLGNRAQLKRDQSDFDGAIALLKEEEQIQRKIANQPAIAQSLTNQALILVLDLNKSSEALPLISEACKLSEEHGLNESLHEIIELLQDLVLSKLGRQKEPIE